MSDVSSEFTLFEIFFSRQCFELKVISVLGNWLQSANLAQIGFVTTQDSGESFCLVFQLVVKSSLVVLNKFIVLYTSQKLNAYR